MASEGKISVIVPAYNVEKYIEKCINSIVSQTYQNLEIIIVNDGSTDKTKDICESFANSDNRITLINQENGGPSAARNTGINAASGDYIGWVDGDDWIENDYFEKFVNTYIEKKADIVVLWNTISKPALIKDDDILKQYFLHNITCFSCSIFTARSMFSGLKYEKFLAGEDFIMGINLMRRAKTVFCDNYNGYHYVKHEDSIVHFNDWRRRMENVNANKVAMQYINDVPKATAKYFGYHLIIDNMWHYRATQKLSKTKELKAFHKLLRKQLRSIIMKTPIFGEDKAVMKKWCTGMMFAIHLI